MRGPLRVDRLLGWLLLGGLLEALRRTVGRLPLGLLEALLGRREALLLGGLLIRGMNRSALPWGGIRALVRGVAVHFSLL
jgi:hypothetical protein